MIIILFLSQPSTVSLIWKLYIEENVLLLVLSKHFQNLKHADGLFLTSQQGMLC